MAGGNVATPMATAMAQRQDTLGNMLSRLLNHEKDGENRGKYFTSRTRFSHYYTGMEGFFCDVNLFFTHQV